MISLHALGKKVVISASRRNCRFSGSGSMMNRMSFSETIFLFFLALIVFGPKKLPEIARQIGKALNEFRRASNEFKAQIEQEISHLEVEKQTVLPPSPAPEGTASRSLNAAPIEAVAPENSIAEAAAIPAASEDEPLFATGSTNSSAEPSPPTEPIPSSEVTSSTAQESHV
jgi:sec-independent protein translocase protein TatB